MKKAANTVLAFLFILGVVPPGWSAGIARPGGLGRGTVTPMAAVQQRYSGLSLAAHLLMTSREGLIIARFEKDFNTPEYYDANRGRTPVIEFLDHMSRESKSELSDIDFLLRNNHAYERRIMEWAQEFLDRNVPIVARQLTLESQKGGKDLKALSETIKKMEHLRKAYAGALERLKDKESVKLFNDAYPAAVQRRVDMRLAVAKGIASEADAWVVDDYDHVPRSPSAGASQTKDVRLLPSRRASAGRSDGKTVSGPALKAFFAIAERWGLRPEERMILLGVEASSTYDEWKRGKTVRLRQDTLERISYVLGIYKALHILIPREESADQWIKSKPNDSSVFGGKSALELMLSGRVSDLALVRRYLDAQLAGS